MPTPRSVRVARHGWRLSSGVAYEQLRWLADGLVDPFAGRPLYQQFDAFGAQSAQLQPDRGDGGREVGGYFQIVEYRDRQVARHVDTCRASREEGANAHGELRDNQRCRGILERPDLREGGLPAGEAVVRLHDVPRSARKAGTPEGGDEPLP